MPRLERSQRSLLRHVGVASAIGAVLLTGCGPTMPDSVRSGTSTTVGWSGTVTNLNPDVEGATPGDRDLGTLTRSRFAHYESGKLEPDTSFGAVSIVGSEPFTVRYDLATPKWSDGVPVDAADLALAWAAGTQADAGFATMRDDLIQSDALVSFDEGERAIEVSFAAPEPEWGSALEVAVPAHVVGQIAFGHDDPMEAKKAVSDAITEAAPQQLSAIAAAWNTGFALTQGEVQSDLALSSGPYLVESVEADATGEQLIRLVPNRRYAGLQTPTLETVELRQLTKRDQLDALGELADVVELEPTLKNAAKVATMERRDYQLRSADDGTVWVVVLRADQGLFTRPQASAAFLRALPRREMVDRGAGGWAEEYRATDSLLMLPDDRSYDFAVADSGFDKKFGSSGSGTDEIVAAGLRPGTAVCVGFDSTNEFARGALKAMKSEMADAGWVIRDCGQERLVRPEQARNADAVLIRVPVPADPSEVAELWGGDSSLPGVSSNQRQELLAKFLVETDPYDARDLRIAIEKSIVDESVAVPIAVSPVVAVAVPSLEGVGLSPNGVGALTARIPEWAESQ